MNLAAILTSKRREKGITQDTLAAHIGVSKQSVSKWENGNSYPDITLLPQLASYFNISVDELIGYEPQLTPDAIHKLCVELLDDFSAKPFDDVINRCRDIVKRHFSCFPLLFQIGVLFIEYGDAVKDDKQRTFILTEAKDLFVRVKTLSDNIELKQLALKSEAVCELMQDKPREVIALLESIKTRIAFHPSVEAMLAKSYQMIEKIHDAKVTLQGAVYESIIALFCNMPHYLSVNIDNKEYFDEICKRTTAIIEIFNANEICPLEIMPFYLEAAKGYLVIGNKEKTFAMLEAYVELAAGDISPCTPKIDTFFTLIDEYGGEVKNRAPFGFSDEFLDRQSIRQFIIDDVIEEPAFNILANEPRYKMLTEKLKNNIHA